MTGSILNKSVYDRDQIEQLQLGIDHGVDISIYENPEYMALQMEWIRKGLEDGIDVSLYASPEFDWFQMEEIYIGIIGLLDVSKYCNPSIPYERMREIRKGLEKGLDLSPFNKYGAKELRELRHALRHNIRITKYIIEGYDAEQLHVIWKAIQEGINVDPYLSKEYRGIALEEIVLGLKKNLKVEVYANTSYSWQQMREIREGLEERLDIEKYCSNMYNASQMHEIRLGLEAGLDVSSYRSLMYTAKEMRKMRLLMIEELTGGQSILMEPGKDGYHEFLFGKDKTGELSVCPDGSIDFSKSYRYALCKTNDVIAIYHVASEGKNGVSNDGRIIKAVKGKEKKILSGLGVYYDEKYKAYIASAAGWIHLDEDEDLLEIKQAITMDNVNAAMGPVTITGNVEVLGNVEAGSDLNVDGDLIVDGHVENAVINCSGNVVIRGGMNGNSKSSITTGKSLICKYIEHYNVNALEDVRTDYIMSGKVNAKGKVIALGHKGSIIGTVVTSQKGITCLQAGSEAEISTELVIEAPEYDDKYEKVLAGKKDKALKELEMLTQAKKRFCIKYSAEERNNNKDFIKIENAIYTKNVELKEIDIGFEELKELKRYIGKATIEVREKTFGNVGFTIGKNRFVTSGENGRLTAEEKNGNIKINKG